jgi:hypothetical protein
VFLLYGVDCTVMMSICQKWERPELMEDLRKLESVTDEQEYTRIKKQIRKESKK